MFFSEPDDDELLELVKYYLTQSVNKNVTIKDVNNISTNMLSMFKEVGLTLLLGNKNEKI